MQAILEAKLDAMVCAVISNKAAAEGLEVAKKAGVPTQIVEIASSRIAHNLILRWPMRFSRIAPT